MSKKTRYFLLLIGFLVFLVLAPLIVLYVRGVSYDFAKKSFVKTGILAIRTEPKNVNVLLDKKLIRQNQGDIRFLKPGEYNLNLEKTGYFPWKKRLQIKANEVTWANPVPKKIYLFFQQPKITSLAQAVTDFYQQASQIFYLANNNLVLSSVQNPSNQQAWPLKKPVSQILPQDANENFLLLFGQNGNASPVCLIFNISAKVLIDASNYCSSNSQVSIGGDGWLYRLNNQTLTKINLENKDETLLAERVLNFILGNDNLYYLKIDQNKLSLIATNLEGQASQKLLDNIPLAKQARILVTRQKAVFLLLDQALYKVNAVLEKLANNVKQLNFSPETESLIIISSGEVNYYDFAKQKLTLVTRSGNNLINPLLLPSINYAFLLKDSRALGMELDTRDQQNSFSFYQSQNLKKFTADSEGKNFLILDESELKAITVR